MCAALVYYSFCFSLFRSRFPFYLCICVEILVVIYARIYLTLSVCLRNGFCLPMDYYIIFLHRIHFYSCVSGFFSLFWLTRALPPLFYSKYFCCCCCWCERINYSHSYGLKTKRLSCPISTEFYTHNFGYLLFFSSLSFALVFLCAYTRVPPAPSLCVSILYMSVDLVPIYESRFVSLSGSFCYVTQTQFYFWSRFFFLGCRSSFALLQVSVPRKKNVIFYSWETSMLSYIHKFDCQTHKYMLYKIVDLLRTFNSFAR